MTPARVIEGERNGIFFSPARRCTTPHLVRAATACGIQALFMETHNDPRNAMSGAITVLDLRYLENVLTQAKAIHEA